MATNELDTFLRSWNREAEGTVKLLKALPAAQYDFRPDATGRSLGELAWHLAEGDAYMSQWVESGKFDMGTKPPNIERPRTVEALADTFRVLGDPTRVRILDALAPGELCVCDIASLVGISESAVSHQLRLLRHLGLVVGRRDGRQVVYELYDDHVAELLEQVVSHVEHVRLGLAGRHQTATA